MPRQLEVGENKNYMLINNNAFLTFNNLLSNHASLYENIYFNK